MRETFATLATLILAAIITDARLYYRRGGWHATYSYLILSRSQRYPIIAFLFGVVAGHLFWPQPDPSTTPSADPDPDPVEP